MKKSVKTKPDQRGKPLTKPIQLGTLVVNESGPIDPKDSKPEKEDTKAELRLLYNLVVSDIKYAKEQQWRIINYALATYVAIFSVWKVIPANKYGAEFWGVIICSFIIMVVGIWMIQIEQDLLQRSRQRIKGITESFTEDFKKVFGDVSPKIRKVHALGTFHVQRGIIILGYLLLVYSLFRIPK
jgi:hypothetical protein